MADSNIADLLGQVISRMDKIQTQEDKLDYLIKKQHLMEKQLSEMASRLDHEKTFMRDQLIETQKDILGHFLDIKFQAQGSLPPNPSRASDKGSVLHQLTQYEHVSGDVIDGVNVKQSILNETLGEEAEGGKPSEIAKGNYMKELPVVKQLIAEMKHNSSEINMDASQQYTDLLLIGKTGTGKSAAGNSILGRKVFQYASSPTSVTNKIQIEYSEMCGRIIKVVDGPGIFDTDLRKRRAFELVIESLKYAIAANPKGYHAILWVVKFGGRFTIEDDQAVMMLKSIFGPLFVEKYTILVMTHGDNFEPVELGTFQEWCSNEAGVFRNLLKECRNRVILFDNKTKDPVKMNEQRAKLLRMVDSLSSQGLRYTNEHFQMAERERERLFIEAKIPMIREETMKEASLIIQQLGQVTLEEREHQLSKLNHLKKRARRLLQSISDQDRGTGVLKDVKKNADHIITTVDGHFQKTKQALEIQEQKKQLAREMEQLKAEREQSIYQNKDDTQQRKQKKFAELLNTFETAEARYGVILEYFRKANQEVEREYHTVAMTHMERMSRMILRAITIFLPKDVSYIFKK